MLVQLVCPHAEVCALFVDVVSNQPPQKVRQHFYLKKPVIFVHVCGIALFLGVSGKCRKKK